MCLHVLPDLVPKALSNPNSCGHQLAVASVISVIGAIEVTKVLRRRPSTDSPERSRPTRAFESAC
jgi:hypothetical protein